MTPEEAYRAGYQAGKLSMPEIVRCKECKHRGEWERAEDIHGSYSYIVFPDGSRCPGQCEDPFYSWRPDDDWFCAEGERLDKTD